MMRSRSANYAGFSLVELVVVIVIIGVISAIAIPRVSQGAKGAADATLVDDLSILRNAIEMYAGEHGGDFPGLRGDGTNGPNTAQAFLNQLDMFSDLSGHVKNTRDVANGYIYGAYLQRKIPPIPVGPNKGKSGLAIDTTNSPPALTGGTEAWVYNPTTGEIIANTNDPNDEGTRTYNQY
jgi:prepilin-type N-terminal cleavage/methylation domain-containing protein